MDVKKQAGLALALAATFTCGGAGAALADNSTASSGGVIQQGDPDAPLTVTGGGVAPTIEVRPGGNTVGDIIVGDNAEGLTVTGANALTITGSGELVATRDNAPVNVTTAAPLKLQDGQGSLSATLSLTGASADLTVTDGTYTVNKLVTDSTANTIGIASTATAKTARLEVDELAMGAASTITVGNAAGNATLIVEHATLNGSTIFADPSFATGQGPSQVAVKSWGPAAMPTNLIDGILIAGQNSTITIGDTNSDLVDRAIGDIGHEMWKATGGYSAAMAFIGPQTLDSGAGALVVNGTLVAPIVPAANTITFTDNSLAVFDLTGVTNVKAALSANTGAVAAPIRQADIGATTAAGHEAGVYFHNAHVTAPGAGYLILDDVTALNVGGAGAATAAFNAQNHWTGDRLHFSSRLLTGDWVVDPIGGDLALNVARDTTVSVQSLYPRMSDGVAGGIVDRLYRSTDPDTRKDVRYDRTTGQNTYDGNTAGQAFISRVTDNAFLGESNPREAARVLEGAARIAVAAGAPALTNSVITKVGGLIAEHNNVLNAAQPAYGNEPGRLGLWVNPFYGVSDVDGLAAGRFDGGYEISYGGAAFGLDYAINGVFRLGLALNVGGGDSESRGDFHQTENTFDFFGVSLYGSSSNGAFGLTGDVGFTGVDSEIKQNLNGALGMGGGLRSDVDSDAFTVGLTGQYRFVAGENLNVTPHLGLRYTKISTDDAIVELSDGKKIFDIATDDQNLFQIPLGVTFSGGITTDGGWTVTPSADLGVLFTAGDTGVESRARVWNTPFSGRAHSDAVDGAAFAGALGLTAGADGGLSLGLEYNLLASGHQTDHQFSGLLRLNF